MLSHCHGIGNLRELQKATEADNGSLKIQRNAKNRKRVVTFAATRQFQTVTWEVASCSEIQTYPLPLSWKKSLGGRKSPAKTRGRTKKKSWINRNEIRRRKFFASAAVPYYFERVLPLIKIIAHSVLQLLLNKLPPFRVTLQHREKIFFCLFVVFKGTWSFPAVRVNDMRVFIFVRDFALKLNYYHRYLPPYYFEYTLSKCVQRIFT